MPCRPTRDWLKLLGVAPVCEVAVLLHDVGAAGRKIIAERRAMRLVLQSDIDDAVQRDAVQGQAAVGGC
jgi:hypothetical protein